MMKTDIKRSQVASVGRPLFVPHIKGSRSGARHQLCLKAGPPPPLQMSLMKQLKNGKVRSSPH